MIIGPALERVVKNFSDTLAVKDNYGKHFPEGSVLTYKELLHTSNRLENSLLEFGLQKGDRVAVQIGTGLGHYLTLIARARVGMSIDPIDRTFVSDEIIHQLNDYPG
jgi:long-chain acyl-CoA synthetase